MANRQYRADFIKQSSNPEEEWIKSSNLLNQNSPSKQYTSDSFQRENASNESPRKNGKTTTLQKSAVELMQDMLRGVKTGEEINPYYSKESQENLVCLLTNQYARSSYINTLSSELPSLNGSVSKNYRLLILLLSEVAKSDIAVKNTKKGLQIQFNHNLIEKQQETLEQLRREKKKKEEEQMKIINEYDDIIANLQRITEQLAKQKQSQK